ncbi:MAG: Crp/Fnr family transcriptional regulator [Oscillospiraceae bacterium]|nr:Crp/Fnr family transcriptional regulator [Oscillospiraceae bacterium]
MKKYVSILKRTKLFSGVGDDDILSMLNCLNATVREYSKGEYVFCQGEYIRNLMILAAGRLHIQEEDYWGNLNILNEIRPGEMFGEAYIVPNSGPLMDDVIAVEESVVLFFDIERILTVCPSACPFHTRLVKNIFYTISDKNKSLVQKLSYMSQRTTREKLLSYLSDEAKRQNSSSFSISFNRQQLADYLSVDRSAMSNELCKLRDEGMLDFHKSEFTLSQAK